MLQKTLNPEKNQSMYDKKGCLLRNFSVQEIKRRKFEIVKLSSG